MDRLKTFLKRKDEHGKRLVTQTVFAARVGTTASTVSKLAAGTLKPSLDLAYAIDRETDGAVPMSSWVRAAPDDSGSIAGDGAASPSNFGANISREARAA